MLRIRSIEECRLDASWVTIGSFDGVHLGHQTIIQQLAHDARMVGISSVVVTFFPHPAVILRGSQDFRYLSTLDERLDKIELLGIDLTLTLTFNRQLASMDAHTFMGLLSRHLGLKQLWIGQGFALGKNRQGTFPVLSEIGTELGYTVKEIQPLLIGTEKASSSQIRQLIQAGKIQQAAYLLGRNYSLPGKIVHGNHRGTSIGFPTANLETFPERIIPAFGIYATWVYLDGHRYQSATNIGVRPTFETKKVPLTIETYILDFNQDIYGKTIELEFVEYIRPELKFASVDSLIDQMRQDTQLARKVLSDDHSSPNLPA
jgi:riboflavin kinase / FMN adenylyltransferase